MGHCNHSITVEAKIMKKKFPTIGEHVAVNYVAQLVTIATIWLAKSTLNFSCTYNSKMSSVTPFYIIEM